MPWPVVDDPTTARQQIQSLANPVRQKGRSYRGFNPACLQDIQLFAAVMRGEHLLQGFCNRDIRQQLIGSARPPCLTGSPPPESLAFSKDCMPMA